MLGDFPNMTFSPRFSPDGNKVAMTLEKNGNSDIYVMDLRTRGVARLTTDPAIDTAPSFSPDGRQITFESDRGGSQQIYVMNADGSDQHRISFGAGRNGTPVWSPRGDLIAFTNQSEGSFRIGVMRPDGSRRAHHLHRLGRRRPDLGAQRPRSDVFPHIAGRTRFANLVGRCDGAQRAARPDAGRCVRSGMVALDPIGRNFVG